MPRAWIGRIINSPKLRRWSYRFSLVFFIVFFTGFCAVVPIDSIVQASQSSNYALNTFVVVGALVLFGVTGIVLTTTRIIMQRSALQDIPKRYIPLDDGDLPKECDVMINETFAKCEEIRSLALNTDGDGDDDGPIDEQFVKHPGLSGPKSELLPPSLSFDEVVRAIGDKLKWGGALIGTETRVPQNASFREIVAYLEQHLIATNFKLNKEYVELYEALRFSGDLITEENFIKFMTMSIEFVKITRLNMADESQLERIRRHYTESEASLGGGGSASLMDHDFYSKFSLPPISNSYNKNGSSLGGSISQISSSWLEPRPGLQFNEAEEESSQTEKEFQHYHDMLRRIGTGQTVLSFRSGKEP